MNNPTYQEVIESAAWAWARHCWAGGREVFEEFTKKFSFSLTGVDNQQFAKDVRNWMDSHSHYFD